MTSTWNEKGQMSTQKGLRGSHLKSKLQSQSSGPATIIPVTYTRNEKCITAAQKVALWYTQKIIVVTLQFWFRYIQKNDISKERNKCNGCSKSGTLVHAKKS